MLNYAISPPVPLLVTLPLQAIVWQLPLQAAVTQSPSQEVEHPALLHALAHPLHVVVPVLAGVLSPSLPAVLLSANVPASLDKFPTFWSAVGPSPVKFTVAIPPQLPIAQFTPQPPSHLFTHEFMQSLSQESLQDALHLLLVQSLLQVEVQLSPHPV